MKPSRYLPSKPFPEYAYVPGKNSHPHSPDPVTEPITELTYSQNECFLYALDLFNFGFFWESHLYLEALWNAHRREGPEAKFFKALIKIAAAGVKIQQGEFLRADDQLAQANTMFRELAKDRNRFFGMDIKEVQHPVVLNIKLP